MPKMSVNIFIATSTFAVHSSEPLDLLEEHDYNVIINPLSRKLSGDELLKFAIDAKGIIAGTEVYTKEILEKLENLKVISRLGVGMDNIALDAAKQKCIQIYRTSTTPALSVAELALGLMINLFRNTTNCFNTLRSGKWEKYMGHLLSNKTLGIIGLGSIGKALVELVQGFNFKLLAFDKYHDQHFAEKNNITYCDLESLLIRADIVSIHLNLSDETKNLMNKERLNQMKPQSILINTSRGEIVDEKALYDVLKDKKIMGAGLDVFNNEPYFGEMLELNNVLLTPHIGAYSREIRRKMEMEAAQNLIQGLQK